MGRWVLVPWTLARATFMGAQLGWALGETMGTGPLARPVLAVGTVAVVWMGIASGAFHEGSESTSA